MSQGCDSAVRIELGRSEVRCCGKRTPSSRFTINWDIPSTSCSVCFFLVKPRNTVSRQTLSTRDFFLADSERNERKHPVASASLEGCWVALLSIAEKARELSNIVRVRIPVKRNRPFYDSPHVCTFAATYIIVACLVSGAFYMRRLWEISAWRRFRDARQGRRWRVQMHTVRREKRYTSRMAIFVWMIKRASKNDY